MHFIMFKTVNVFKTFETIINHNICKIIAVAFFKYFVSIRIVFKVFP